MPINFDRSQKRWTLIQKFKESNRARTPGKWPIEEMVFPEGDPDREFIEFVTENAQALTEALED